jgi:WD40 repeat protein
VRIETRLLGALAIAVLGTTLAQCSGAARSALPASVATAPMLDTALLPASAMTAGSIDHHPHPISAALTWTHIPSSATQVVVAPDGTLWALGSGALTTNRKIWHYSGGTWKNLPGAGVRLAVAPDGTPWVISTVGGLYHYIGGVWVGVGGDSADLAEDQSGNAWVINKGASADNRIWEFDGSWHLEHGAGKYVAAMPDSLIYAMTSSGKLYQSTTPTATSYTGCPGGAVVDIAPNQDGSGYYFLSAASRGVAAPIYAYTDTTPGNCHAGTYVNTGTKATSISSNGATLAIVGTDGSIYTTPINKALPPDAGGEYNLDGGTDNAYGPQSSCVQDSAGDSGSACYLLSQSGAVIAGANDGLGVQYANATITFGQTLGGLGRLWTLKSGQPNAIALSGTMDAVVTPAAGSPFACTFTVTGTYDDQVGNAPAATYSVTYSNGACSGGTDSGGTFTLQQPPSCSAAVPFSDRDRRRVRPDHVTTPC